jgi:ABC-type Fe3+-hydroxamate transport system substrate-binding protein
MLPGLTETVAYLGGVDRLVAVTPHCDRPAQVAQLPRLPVLPIAWEALRDLAPDLVLVDATLLGGQVDELRRRIGAVLPLESRSLAHLARSVQLLAEVLDTEPARAAAGDFVRDLDAALAAVAPRARATSPRVLLLAQDDPVYVLGPGSLLDDMLAAVGAVNVACDLGRASGPFAAELVRARRPDWVLTTGGELPASRRASWAQLPALRLGHVARADADDLVRAGPRTPAALRRLADVLAGRRPPAALECAP